MNWSFFSELERLFAFWKAEKFIFHGPKRLFERENGEGLPADEIFSKNATKYLFRLLCVTKDRRDLKTLQI